MVVTSNLTPVLRLLPINWWQRPIAELAGLAPIQSLQLPLFDSAKVQVEIKREDLLCPHLGGNKLYKLYFHIQRAQQLQADTLVSFGGAFSNHIYALAKVAAELGLKMKAFIRGDETEPLSPTLVDARALGAELVFVSRERYRQKHTSTFASDHNLYRKGNYIIPEGGGDLRGALGMAAYAHAVITNNQPFSAILLAAGTGASMAGVMAATGVQGLEDRPAVHGVLTLKGSTKATNAFALHALALARSVGRIARAEHCRLRSSRFCWRLHTEYHGGGYGPARGEMASNIQRFTATTGVPLDPVYTGKLVLAAEDLIKQGAWPSGSRILVVHTGGLQGSRPLTA